MNEMDGYEEFFIPVEVLKAKSLVVVDVRTPEEYEEGCIDNSLNIPLQELPYNYEHLRDYEHVVVICKSGVRSEFAKDFLRRMGFPSVFNGGGWDYFDRVLQGVNA